MNRFAQPAGAAHAISDYARGSGANGLDIRVTAQLLRRYICVERALMHALAGWFLAVPPYEIKYAMADHLFNHSEHVDWLRHRLEEMRGGQPDASVEPDLIECAAAIMHAEDCAAFIEGAYLEFQQGFLDACRDHLAAGDAIANAAELRLIRRIADDLQEHIAWADDALARLRSSPDAKPSSGEHRRRIARLLRQAGGVSGREARETTSPRDANVGVDRVASFSRPRTIVFDSRIRIGELMPYDQRQSSDSATATFEQFKVFFNEMYAAALLASVLYDAPPTLPWEFFHDFARHFWDEVRHSQFGNIRLRELGGEPDVCNPILFERTEGLSVLHRICYLTMGLETYFMPRKGARVREYAARGDARSQLFADQDWSDETTHVHFGKHWLGELLKNDFRTPDDILGEVREHLEKVTGQKQDKIAAPF